MQHHRPCHPELRGQQPYAFRPALAFLGKLQPAGHFLSESLREKGWDVAQAGVPLVLSRGGKGERGRGGGWGDQAAKEEEEGWRRGEIGIFMCGGLAGAGTGWWARGPRSLGLRWLQWWGCLVARTPALVIALRSVRSAGEGGMEEVKKPWSHTHTQIRDRKGRETALAPGYWFCSVTLAHFPLSASRCAASPLGLQRLSEEWPAWAGAERLMGSSSDLEPFGEQSRVLAAAHTHTSTSPHSARRRFQVLFSLMCMCSLSMSVPGLLWSSSKTSCAPPASPSILSCYQSGRIWRQSYPNSVPTEVMLFWRYGPALHCHY